MRQGADPGLVVVGATVGEASVEQRLQLGDAAPGLLLVHADERLGREWAGPLPGSRWGSHAVQVQSARSPVTRRTSET